MFDTLVWRSGLGFLVVSTAGVLAAVAYFRIRKKRFEYRQTIPDSSPSGKEMVIKGLYSEIKAHRVLDRRRGA